MAGKTVGKGVATSDKPTEGTRIIKGPVFVVQVTGIGRVEIPVPQGGLEPAEALARAYHRVYETRPPNVAQLIVDVALDAEGNHATARFEAP